MTRPLEPIAARLPRPLVNVAKRQIARAVSWNLDALATLWWTDKGPRLHGYTTYYRRHLRDRRRSVRAVLEIGIGGYEVRRYGGQSLYMWRSYFPRATIYGLDLYEKRLESNSRVVVLRADQSDASDLRRAVAACPPLDLIVDDGSHVGADVITSFNTLFPHLRNGGIYAIEDVFCAYNPDFGGGPPGSADTAIQLSKDLIDDLNLGRRPVAAVHAYRGLVLIEKSADHRGRRVTARDRSVP